MLLAPWKPVAVLSVVALTSPVAGLTLGRPLLMSTSQIRRPDKSFQRRGSTRSSLPDLHVSITTALSGAHDQRLFEPLGVGMRRDLKMRLPFLKVCCGSSKTFPVCSPHVVPFRMKSQILPMVSTRNV
jgi:hypothetical protein